jgi:hypothetical protein
MPGRRIFYKFQKLIAVELPVSTFIKFQRLRIERWLIKKDKAPVGMVAIQTLSDVG